MSHHEERTIFVPFLDAGVKEVKDPSRNREIQSSMRKKEYIINRDRKLEASWHNGKFSTLGEGLEDHIKLILPMTRLTGKHLILK